MPELNNKPNDPVSLTATGKNPYTGFVEMAVHDLQAPLRKLGVLADRLANKYKDQVDAEVQEYTSRINTCISDVRSLIDGLKDFGNANFEQPDYSSCDMEQMVRRVMHESEADIREKKAIINVSALPVIEADKGQCRQLLKAILDNALLFSKKDNAPIIDISSFELTPEEKTQSELDTGKRYYKIIISDNGIGFSPQDAKNIFNPFVRLHGKSFPGNGLGLAIAKRIIDNHEGIIYAEAEENAGARFIFILPEKL
jgi:light-regulated signal transduction histidine kinase (bacteriophytochrome)